MECRCGSEKCRGVLGPTTKDKDIKEALKPITNGASNKRKLHEALGDSLTAILPQKKTIKSAFKAAKGWVYIKDEPAPKAKKVSERTERKVHKVVKTKVTKTASVGRPKKLGRPRLEKKKVIKSASKSAVAAKKMRGPNGTFLKATPAATPAKPAGEAVQQGVVKTVKGRKGNGGAKKSMRIVENGEVENDATELLGDDSWMAGKE
jgi:hypothetical protein